LEKAKAEEERESIARSEWHENGHTHTHGTQIEHKDSGVQAGRAQSAALWGGGGGNQAFRRVGL